MSMGSRSFAVALGIAGLVTLGCKGITTPSSNQTETFPGTLQAKGSVNHHFSASKSGEFTAKLTAWGPNSNIFAGLIWTFGSNDGSCTSILQQNNFVALNAQGLFGSVVRGSYCIVIFDPGTLTASQTYTITISHP